MKNEYLKFSAGNLVCLVALLGIITLASCENDFDKTESNDASAALEEIEVVDDNTVKIESKASLLTIFKSYKENVANQNNFNDKIRKIQNKGFKSLTPLFREGDSEGVQKFVLEKKKRIAKRNVEFGITSKPGANEEVALDDELISDPLLSSLLNENREIIVGDSLYKYTETGLYFCHVNNKQKLYDYLNKTSVTSRMSKFTKTRMTGKAMPQVVVADDGINQFLPTPAYIQPIDPGSGGGGGGGYTPPAPPVTTSPKLIKQNLEISYIEKNSIWEKVFGASDKAEDYYSDNRRIQVSFWNQNYYLFSSVGCSARLQKREKTLGVSYWEKSYADIIELGVNDVQYDYKFNTPVYNQGSYNYSTVFFEYKGVKYNIDGKIITKLPTDGPRFIFDTGDPEEGLTIFIHNNEYDLLTAKELNKAIDVLAKAFATKMPSTVDKVLLNDKIKNESLKYNVLKAPSLSNTVTFKTQNVKWSRNDDNAITNYFDFNFLLTWKSTYENTEDYLNGLKGATSYSNVSIDLYGAALHNGEWRGRRLLLSN
ncbi:MULTISPECIES: hypothetical protein [unclassified Flavobacterium]|uniref:hypothetical protein n=1 Tax=unclassified Flavobacterium TaxID=196869 RepID=UPI0006AB99E2|nr:MULTISPECIES: hypothetical protein [unclassified Flavobacterium]KOP39631.1 hypothetical protein AKO67_03500 [Flavobacterium sp. VMW]OWU90183.1 hypothetical protein APR43_13980 [Flavobacterium sp. NLM]